MDSPAHLQYLHLSACRCLAGSTTFEYAFAGILYVTSHRPPRLGLVALRDGLEDQPMLPLTSKDPLSRLDQGQIPIEPDAN